MARSIEELQSVKICKDCKKEKPVDEFYFIKSKKKYLSRCKPCYSEHRKDAKNKYVETHKEEIKKRMREYGKANPEKRRAYYYKNREKLMALNKASYLKYRDKNIQKRKDWYIENKESHAIAREKYAIENKDKLRAARRKWENERMKTDVEFSLQKRLRGRIREAAKGVYKKSKRTEELIGCTIEEFKKHIENQFLEGMTWENWKQDGWHIDHKIPISWFNLANENCRKMAFNYKNMQPLWSQDNLEKKNKFHHEMIF